MAKNHLIGNYTKYEFKSLVTKATAEFKKIWEAKPSDGGVSKKKAGIVELLKGMQVGKADQIADLIIANGPCAAKVTGSKFLTFVPFACVVPTRNRNHHAYRLNEPVIMIHGEDGANKEMFGMDKKGCIINRSATAKDGLSHLPRLRESLRPATAWEITQIVDNLFA